MSSSGSISATRAAHSPPTRIFDLPADPRRPVRLDGSGSVARVKRAPERLALGAATSMRMKIGLGDVTRNRFVVVGVNHRIAWHHLALFEWRYDLEEVDGGTLVTESFDYDRPTAFSIIALGLPERKRRATEGSSDRLGATVTS